MMKAYEQASREVIRFLESLRGTELDLPTSVIRYWEEAIRIGKSANPDWHRAEVFCKSIKTILGALDSDIMRMDRDEGLASILYGAIFLGQNDLHEAISFFEQGARCLHYRGYDDFQSLAFFGRAFAHKEQKNWPGASVALQRALDAVLALPLYLKSDRSEDLQRRIEEEIRFVTEASMKDTGRKPKPFRPPPPNPAWIPIVSDIAAGLGYIAEENVLEDLLLGDNHSNRADFGVKVAGDSMKGHGILPGDIALIRKHQRVEAQEIVAAVITTREMEALGVLKQYYRYEKRTDMQHWLLKSSNPLSEHLVVMEHGVNEEMIYDLYAKETQSGRICNPMKYYEDASLEIAGKYVGLVRTVAF